MDNVSILNIGLHDPDHGTAKSHHCPAMNSDRETIPVEAPERPDPKLPPLHAIPAWIGSLCPKVQP